MYLNQQKRNVRRNCLFSDFNDFEVCYRHQHFEQLLLMHINDSRSWFPRYSQETVGTIMVNSAYIVRAQQRIHHYQPPHGTVVG